MKYKTSWNSTCGLWSLKGVEGRYLGVQIMENEFEYLAGRGGHGGHLAEKFVKKYFS